MSIYPTEEKQHVDSRTTESRNCHLKSGMFKILNSLSFRIFRCIIINYHSEYICKGKEIGVVSFWQEMRLLICSIFKIFPNPDTRGPSRKQHFLPVQKVKPAQFQSYLFPLVTPKVIILRLQRLNCVCCSHNNQRSCLSSLTVTSCLSFFLKVSG